MGMVNVVMGTCTLRLRSAPRLLSTDVFPSDVSRLGGPSGPPDVDNDHVERHRNDTRDLLISGNVSVEPSS